uniref:EF-hand domain-containing protein n=1 Tax=Guillardia theta TaxID=55529 RepID=A0A7S4KVP2_GUITH|mmetsp:Transcript_32081/g.102173  ORF Transcript_32081/g.102173 Transcript_32081/m.102173 type:complete len:1168 (+) Transcript_32081:54-3557(+)
MADPLADMQSRQEEDTDVTDNKQQVTESIERSLRAISMATARKNQGSENETQHQDEIREGEGLQKKSKEKKRPAALQIEKISSSTPEKHNDKDASKSALMEESSSLTGDWSRREQQSFQPSSFNQDVMSRSNMLRRRVRRSPEVFSPVVETANDGIISPVPREVQSQSEKVPRLESNYDIDPDADDDYQDEGSHYHQDEFHNSAMPQGFSRSAYNPRDQAHVAYGGESGWSRKAQVGRTSSYSQLTPKGFDSKQGYGMGSGNDIIRTLSAPIYSGENLSPQTLSTHAMKFSQSLPREQYYGYQEQDRIRQFQLERYDSFSSCDSGLFRSHPYMGMGDPMSPTSRQFHMANETDEYHQLDILLQGLGFYCDESEKDVLIKAFMCPVCDTSNAVYTTTTDQIRAVHDAFGLIDADQDGAITLTDLRDIASWASDDSGTDFINHLLDELPHGEDVPITKKEFILAFARCLIYNDEVEVEEVLEKRAYEYRRIGKLLGMERVQSQFSWPKFWLSFFSDALAFISFPLCKLSDGIRLGKHHRNMSLYDILSESQWLPEPYTSFDSFQYYLMVLWLPCIFSLVIFFVFYSQMDKISVLEVLSPIGVYIMRGMYIATISGYEHPRLVLRRLNPALSSELKRNELQAVFAFRAHTPEGHAVDHIGAITDVIFMDKFRLFSVAASALAGIIHGLTPTFHRIFIQTPLDESLGICLMPEELPLLTQIYVWICGGKDWVHLIVSVPAAIISGYLTFRLVYLAMAGYQNDLTFFYKLTLFRSSTQAEPFLRYRARWIQAINLDKHPKNCRREFLQFLNLQKHDDLLLWCFIRHLLVESYAGFKSKQGDIIVSYLFVSVLAYTCYICFYVGGPELSVFDLRARWDVLVFSSLLLAIINLKLSIHHLRQNDIALLQKEMYAASMAENENEGQDRYFDDVSEQPDVYDANNIPGGEGALRGDPFQRMQSMGSEMESGSSTPRLRGWGMTSSWAEGRDGREEEMLKAEKQAHNLKVHQTGFRPPLEEREYFGSVPASARPDLEDPSMPQRLASPLHPRQFPGPQMYRRERTDPNGRAPGVFMAFEHMGMGAAGDYNMFSTRWPNVPPVDDVASNLPDTGYKSKHKKLQMLLDHTARYIREFDRPPRLLSFTVSVHFLRYIFLPLLSPIFALFRSYVFEGSKSN